MKSKCVYLYAVFSLLILLSGFSCSNISLKDVSDSESSGTESEVYKSRIEGGDIENIKIYPYNAFIYTKYNKTFRAACSGSIIGIKWILTAGHCKLDGIPSKKIRVCVGSANRYEGKKYNVKNAIRHPEYKVQYKSTTPTYIYNDIMVLELEKKLVYGSKVEKIMIGTKEDIADEKKGIITGYGADVQTTESSKNASKLLRSAKVDIMTRETCVSWYARIAVGEFCAGRDGSYICMGDSGGPIVSDTPVGRRLLGVASYGSVGSDGVCKKLPGVYFSVPSVRDWILGITGELPKETSNETTN